eukprot:10082874-Prorocentrum_lima.AAC.1
MAVSTCTPVASMCRSRVHGGWPSLRGQRRQGAGLKLLEPQPPRGAPEPRASSRLFSSAGTTWMT